MCVTEMETETERERETETEKERERETKMEKVFSTRLPITVIACIVAEDYNRYVNFHAEHMLLYV